jgi:glycosyltransferase involved in cell wall biosynthesis
MRILWVKVGGLWLPDNGERIRSFRILTELSRRHEVTLLTTHQSFDERAELRMAFPSCRRIDSVPHVLRRRAGLLFGSALLRSWLSPLPVHLQRWRSRGLQQRVARALSSGAVDVCIVDFLASLPNLPRRTEVPLLLFEHGVEHLLWKRLADAEPNRVKRAAFELEWKKMKRYEARACLRVRRTITVSEKDRDVLAAAAPGADLRVVPPGVDVSYFRPNGYPEDPSKLVFSGSMNWYPNEDAIVRFLEDCFPRIRREMPRVSLSVVGRNPTPRLRAFAGDGVSVKGTFQDPRPYLAEGAIYVDPVRIESGTRVEIFEALAMGKAVVSTGVGTEGLPLVAGRHYVRADQPEDFAREVVSLLKDSKRRKELGAAGRRLVEERFGWPQVTRELQDCLLDLVKAS